MRLTPLDIRKQEFRKAMRGLDPEEVYAFLTTVAEEYEAVLNDNKALRERLLELDDKVQEYRSLEKTLRDTLLTAERATAEAKNNARREAELIVKQAEIDAEKGVRDIKENAMRLRQEVQSLKRQRDSYLTRMKMLAEAHMKFIDSAESDFRDDDAVLDEVEERVSQHVEEATPESARSRRATAPAPEPPAEHQRPAADEDASETDEAQSSGKSRRKGRGGQGGHATSGNGPAAPMPQQAPLSELLDQVIDSQRTGTSSKGPVPNAPADAAKAGKGGDKWSLDRIKSDILGKSAENE